MLLSNFWPNVLIIKKNKKKRKKTTKTPKKYILDIFALFLAFLASSQKNLNYWFSRWADIDIACFFFFKSNTDVSPSIWKTMIFLSINKEEN